MDSFETPRLLLRPLAAEDEASYCALYTDPGVMAHIGAPLAADAAQRRFAGARRRNADPEGADRQWAVLDRASGSMLGLLALFRDPGDPGNAEIGVMLLPAAHRRGFGRELVEAVVTRAFDRGGLRRVWARYSPANAATAAMLAACGFERGPDLGGAVSAAITPESRRRSTGKLSAVSCGMGGAGGGE